MVKKKSAKKAARKINFHLLTLFPGIEDSYLGVSILKRAQEEKQISIKSYNIRDFSGDKHQTVDDTPYGGGAGMVLRAEPILRAVKNLKLKKPKTKVIILSAKGCQFNQRLASAWAGRYQDIVFIAGRYEGVDERVRRALRAEEVSIGPYVLTDGDVAAMVMISAIARLIPGVIRIDSLKEESHWHQLLKDEAVVKAGQFQQADLEYPHYTRPAVLEWQGKKYRVPSVLLSGDHKKIAVWRKRHRA